MEAKGVCVIFTLLCWVSFGSARVLKVYSDGDDVSTDAVDVTAFGAIGDGNTDDSPAFLKAWTKACASSSPPTLVVPSGKSFLLSPLTFEGPCKASKVHVQIFGNISAPDHVSAWTDSDKGHWIMFQSVNGLKINGSAHIDGQGSSWWKCKKDDKCEDAPTAVLINHCDDFEIKNLKIANSQQMHMVVQSSTGVKISQVQITAPGDSPNTDGIHIQGCTQVEISNSVIQTGDDCISIGTDVSHVNISKITCGPGHGISIGSLGRYGDAAAVEHIHVSNCTFTNTMNGARIKTWQGGKGYARVITFENIIIDSSDNPIIIDQFYHAGDGHRENKTSAVQVSDVSFININGTSSDKEAIQLACSETVGCTDIRLEHIHLTAAAKNKNSSVTSYCLNASGTFTDVNPQLDCHSKR